MESIVFRYTDNDLIRRDNGECDQPGCENESRFRVGTDCSCHLRLFSCYMHLQKAVMCMSERDDMHTGKETVTVTPL